MGAAGSPFPSSNAHLLAEIARAELLFRAYALASSHPHENVSTRPLPADQAIYALLDAPPIPRSDQPFPALNEAFAEARLLAEQIAARAEQSLRIGIPLRLPMLARRFGLQRIDLDLLLLALAPELDLDCAARGRPSAGMAIEALCPDAESRFAARHRLGHATPLFRFSLIRLADEPAPSNAPLPVRTLEIDPRIAAFLLGDDTIDPRLKLFADIISPSACLDDLILPPSLSRGLALYLDHAKTLNPAPVFYLEGPYGSGKRTLAQALCARASLPLLSVDANALLAAGEEIFVRLAPLIAREARLQNAAVHWIGAGAALQPDKASARAALLGALAEYQGLAFLSGPMSWEPEGTLQNRPFIRAELPRPTALEQARLWEMALSKERAPDVDLHALTAMFRLTGGQIRDAAAAARDLAGLRDPSSTSISMDDLRTACRRRHGKRLGALARILPPHHTWDDLVLPPDRKAILLEICAHLRHRGRVLGEWGLDRKLSTGKGLAALFSGPPGTGKTMAAGVIAAELGVSLYHIDLASVVSKYIGETEKHLAELFDDAESANAALIFDEADALFGKRSEIRDAHDRYANIETSYLLQRIESYEGIVFLASNLMKNIDDAFIRRLAFIVEFPFPGFAERLRIWQGLWAAETQLDPDIDFTFLAQKVELSGGYLRNIALAAAYLAAEEGRPIAMRHLLHATRREYQKMGKVMDHGAFASSR